MPSPCTKPQASRANNPSHSQFNAAPPQAASTQDTHDRAALDKGSSKNIGQDNDEEGDDDDDDADFEAIFAAELAKEMEKMMGAMQQKPGNNSSASTDKKAGPAGAQSLGGLPDLDDEEKAMLEDKDLKEAFERIMQSAKMGEAGAGDDDFDLAEFSKLMNGLGAGGGLPDLEGLASAPSSSSSKATPKTANGSGKASAPKPQNFEDALQATMSRLADSEAQHKSRSAKGSKDSDDPLAALMAQMEALGGLPGMNGQGGDDENLPEVLDSLMDQLMSKELLHEPITELKRKVCYVLPIAAPLAEKSFMHS